MKHEVVDAVWLDEHTECSLDELVEHSKLPESVLRALLECGVIESRDSATGSLFFDGFEMATLRKAGRLLSDFELDVNAIALALVLLRRISKLEYQVQQLGAAASKT